MNDKLVDLIIDRLTEFKDCSKGDKTLERGEKVFVMTVTHYWTGCIVENTPEFLVLEDAAWIADTGRFHDAMKSGEFDEIEPVEQLVYVNKASIVTVMPVRFKLPRTQK